MADYEELVELGFEGIDKFANKYHDTVYDHLPAWRRKQNKKQAQAQAQQAQVQQQQNPAPPADEQPRARELPKEDRDALYNQNDDMSYAQSQYSSYPDRGQEYRGYPDARDARYVQEETTTYRRSPNNNGAIVMHDREVYADRSGYERDPRDISPRRDYAYGYDDRQVRARPTPNRMRSTSWSPPRNQQRYDDGSRRRRRSRSRSRSRENDDSWHKGRLAATLAGGLIGGLAGNRVTKGQKYDTAATIGGAVLGGIASSEIAERFERKKDEKRAERAREDHAWEQKHGDGGRYDSDRRRSRDSREYRDRDWCDRCRCDISRCRCR